MVTIDYHRYMASREWALKREAVKERADNICERCHDAPVQNIHHLSYKNLGDENLETELIGVCRLCHEFVSAKRDTDPAVEVVTQLIGKYGLEPDAADHFTLAFCSWTTGLTTRGYYFHGDLKTTEQPQKDQWDSYMDEAIIVVPLSKGIWYHCNSY